LNLGSSSTRLHPRVINLDISDIPEVDIVASGNRLPFRDESLALVVAQEVLEHTPDPFAVCAEVQRVLRRGGLFYLQVPFQIGWHSGPRDYWRFSDDALREILDNEDWNLLELGYSLGYGSGFYRIAVEYAAITASLIARPLYLPTKAIAALLLVPFRWVDGLTRFSPEGRRIAGGFFAIASKR
jgi:SAM-dependent methyltransferase